MITVWGRITSINVQKVMWTLAELGIEAERHDVGGPFGGTDDPAFVALNPNRKVPVLKDGDLVLWESNAIVRYLASRYGAGRLWPEDPAARAASDKWMDWASTVVNPHITPAFMQLIRTPEAERDMALVERSAKATAADLEILDAFLEGQRYIGGNEIDIGDLAVGPIAWRYDQLPIDKPALPDVRAWYDRLRERPGYREQVMIPLS